MKRSERSAEITRVEGDDEDGHMRDDHSHEGEGGGNGGGTEDEAGSTGDLEVRASEARGHAHSHLLALSNSGLIFSFTLIFGEGFSSLLLSSEGFLGFSNSGILDFLGLRLGGFLGILVNDDGSGTTTFGHALSSGLGLGGGITEVGLKLPLTVSLDHILEGGVVFGGSGFLFGGSGEGGEADGGDEGFHSVRFN